MIILTALNVNGQPIRVQEVSRCPQVGEFVKIDNDVYEVWRVITSLNNSSQARVNIQLGASLNTFTSRQNTNFIAF